jgi:hypothetical protein
VLENKRRLRNAGHISENLNDLIRDSNTKCISELHTGRRTFYILCEMFRDVGGLKGPPNMTLEEIVAQFLYTLSHHLRIEQLESVSTEAVRQLVDNSTYVF